MLQDSRYCRSCERQTMHTANPLNHLLHLILTILTVGVWGLVWIGLVVLRAVTGPGYRCVKCGLKN